MPAAPGSRTLSGDAPHIFLIAGPDWKGTVPERMELLRSPTNLGGIGGRTDCAGPDDYTAVNRIQNEYQLMPLSAWGEPSAPPSNVSLKEGADGETLVNEQVMAVKAGQYFSNLNRLLATNPPCAEDAPMLKKLCSLGIAPGSRSPPKDLDANGVAALDGGVALGKAAMAAEMKSLGKIVNHW